MVEYIMNQLIIVAGQWQQFGEKQYEQLFEILLGELQEAAGLDREAAIEYLITNLGEKKVAAWSNFLCLVFIAS